MTTAVNNKDKVYQLIDVSGGAFYCNLCGISEVESENNIVKRYEFWNNKPKFITQNQINERLKIK